MRALLEWRLTVTALVPPRASFAMSLNDYIDVLTDKSVAFETYQYCCILAFNARKDFNDLRTSLLSCTFSLSYPSNSSSSSGSLTTTEPPQPPTQVTRDTSEHTQPRFAHSTSLIADGFGDQRSTRRKVASRSRNRSRSQGTKDGRGEAESRESGRLTFRTVLRTDARSVPFCAPARRAFFADRSAEVGSRGV